MTENKNKSGKNKIIAVIVAAVAVIAVVAAVCIFFTRNNYLANSMRLLRIEGTVSIEDSKGGSKPVIDNMRFRSGDALITGSDGLASVGLDDTKIVTLQNDSRSEFVKNGKQLELKLTQGAVFFNVTQKLNADEKFEIKTATMTAGIRGTSGIVYYDADDGNRESLMVTDGVVEVSATNPKDNETRSVKVEGGKIVKVYFYDNDTLHDSVEFELGEITEKDLSKFTLGWIADNDELLSRISTYTGWDKDNLKKALLGLANGEEPTKPFESESTTTAEPPITTTTAAPTPEPSATTAAPKKPAPKKPAKKKTTTRVVRRTKKKKSTRKTSPASSSGSNSSVRRIITEQQVN